MKIAYFDCFAGIAGDMVLGAFLDCGVPLDELKKGLASLPVKGWDIEATPVLKGGIHGLKVRVSHDGHSDDEEFAARKVAGRPLVDLHHDHALEFGEGYEPAAGHDHSHGHEVVPRFVDQHNDVLVNLDPKLLHGDAEHSHAVHDHHHDDHDHTHHHHDHESHDHNHSHGDHHHDHDHDHSHDDDSRHSHDHGDHHEHAHGRSMAEIRALIEASELSPRVRETALAVFGGIAVVEAELHHSTPDEIHFHEIGGVDSLIDICGAAWCLEYLGIERVYCSALPYSTGTVECAHGTMPVPAPATLKLLRGAPMVPTGLTGEMITPTGAGILAALTQGYGDPPAFTPQQVGFGAGTKDWPGRPNLLRITIGEMADAGAAANVTAGAGDDAADDGLEWSTLALLETNVDDMNPELWSHVLDRLFAAGALDAWLTPAQMKKNRPAQTLSVLCEELRQGAALRVILRETTSLGVRVSTVRRAALPREMTSVETGWGTVGIKVARWREGGVVRAAPELDDVARLARESGAPAGEIYAAAARAWQNVGEQENLMGTNAVALPSSGRNAAAPERSYGSPAQQAPVVVAGSEQSGQAQQ